MTDLINTPTFMQDDNDWPYGEPDVVRYAEFLRALDDDDFIAGVDLGE